MNNTINKQMQLNNCIVRCSFYVFKLYACDYCKFIKLNIIIYIYLNSTTLQRKRNSRRLIPYRFKVLKQSTNASLFNVHAHLTMENQFFNFIYCMTTPLYIGIYSHD